MVPEVPGEQDGLARRLDAEHVGVQGGVVHIERADLDAGNGCHPFPRLVGPHLFHDGAALFRRVPVDVGDQDAQDVLGQGADVHGHTRWDFFKQAVVVAVVVGEQHRAVLAGAEHLLDHLTVLRLGVSVRPQQVGPEVDEDAVFLSADLGAAAADLVGAPVDGQLGHIVTPYKFLSQSPEAAGDILQGFPRALIPRRLFLSRCFWNRLDECKNFCTS